MAALDAAIQPPRPHPELVEGRRGNKALCRSLDGPVKPGHDSLLETLVVEMKWPAEAGHFCFGSLNA
jgi:hypothetical protein